HRGDGQNYVNQPRKRWLHPLRSSIPFFRMTYHYSERVDEAAEDGERKRQTCARDGFPKAHPGAQFKELSGRNMRHGACTRSPHRPITSESFQRWLWQQLPRRRLSVRQFRCRQLPSQSLRSRILPEILHPVSSIHWPVSWSSATSVCLLYSAVFPCGRVPSGAF